MVLCVGAYHGIVQKNYNIHGPQAIDQGFIYVNAATNFKRHVMMAFKDVAIFVTIKSLSDSRRELFLKKNKKTYDERQ